MRPASMNLFPPQNLPAGSPIVEVTRSVVADRSHYARMTRPEIRCRSILSPTRTNMVRNFTPMMAIRVISLTKAIIR